jgi:hypothetical protein
MQFYLKSFYYFLLVFILGMANLSFAAMSELRVRNRVSDTKVDISLDLLCGGNVIAYQARRYTSALDENPITIEREKTATWANCVHADKTYFEKYINKGVTDHSNIFVTINDLRSDEATTYRFHIISTQNKEPIEKCIKFAGRNFLIKMTHTGNYKYDAVWHILTTIDVDESKNECKS